MKDAHRGGCPGEGVGARGPARSPSLARWLPLAYAGVAGAWIAASETILAPSSSAEVTTGWAIGRGLAFVAATAVALHAGLRWGLSRDRGAREPRRRYELLAEHGQEVILFVRASDGRILDANAAAVAAYGYTPDELRALTVFDLRVCGPPDVAAQMAQADAGGIRFEAVHRRKDGSTFPVEVGSQGATIDGERVLVSAVRDVTERKRAEDALRESEERLALAVEAVGLGTFHATPWGELQLSPRAREIFGLPEGRRVPDFDAFLGLIHPEDRAQVGADAVRWVDPRGDGRYHGEYRCVRPGGSTCWVSVHGIARFGEVDGAQKPVRLVGTVLDVTERRRAEERIAGAGRELRALVEKLPVGVFVSRAGRIAYANPALAGALGHDRPAELVGKAPEELLGPADGADGAEPWRGVPPPGREWRVVRPDGRVVTLESSTARALEFEGEPGVLCTLRDLTELKGVQAQLMQSDRLASIGMLAAGVAHEINNPLACAKAALDFLAERLPEIAAPGDARGEALEAVAEGQGGVARVRRVVRDLATFSSMREDRRAPIDLEPVVESAINLAANEIKPRAHLVRAYASAPRVLANEARLGQVVLNLLINAAQATPEGRAEENEIRVSVGADVRGWATLEVSDSGCGLPAGVDERIFDPFFTTKSKGIGTGLGLSICRNIVVSLGGEITAEARAGRGAIFRVALPPAPEARSEPEAALAPRGDVPRRRGRVLVVDDEPGVANAVRRILAPEHDVVVTTRAEDARDAIARGERFDAILCDLMMPQMNGMELHAELVRLAPEQADRMVVMTGGAFTEGGREFLGRVALPRIDKPFDAGRLEAVVRALVPR